MSSAHVCSISECSTAPSGRRAPGPRIRFAQSAVAHEAKDARACHQHRRASPRRSIVKHPPDHGYVVVPAEAVRHHNYRRRRLVHDESELGLPVNGDDRVDDGTQTDHSLEEHNCLPPIGSWARTTSPLAHERSELRSQPIHLCPEIPVGKLHRPVHDGQVVGVVPNGPSEQRRKGSRRPRARAPGTSDRRPGCPQRHLVRVTRAERLRPAPSDTR